jgi:hypothetical protein
MNFLKALKARLKGETHLGRYKVRDAAFLGRMPAGSPGTVTRTHPASIFGALNDPSSGHPLSLYGQACLANGTLNTVRSILTSDTTITAIFGVSVRPYPIQGVPQAVVGAPESFNTGGPPASGEVDILRSGSILVPVSGTVTGPSLGGLVYVWIAASSGLHVLGGFEVAPTSGSTITLDAKSSWNGPADANGVAELCFNI